MRTPEAEEPADVAGLRTIPERRERYVDAQGRAVVDLMLVAVRAG